MKKGKEQKPGDFSNNPFKTLKGLKPKPAPLREKTAASPVDAETADDATVFLRAVSDVKKMDSSPAQTAKSRRPPLQQRRAAADAEEEERRLFLQAMGNMGPVFRDAMPESEETREQQRSSSGRMRQLKRGTIRISAELDLHGFLKDGALARLEHFITSEYSRGRQAVLVITGKGTNSPEGPVLPGAVSRWLREPGKAMVAEFHPAPRDKGGSGAFVVFLKQRK